MNILNKKVSFKQLFSERTVFEGGGEINLDAVEKAYDVFKRDDRKNNISEKTYKEAEKISGLETKDVNMISWGYYDNSPPQKIYENIKAQKFRDNLFKKKSKDFQKRLRTALGKHKQEFLDALQDRRNNIEDIGAYERVEEVVKKILRELGAKDEIINLPFTENEMYSGEYTPTRAFRYFVEELKAMHEDGVLD